MDNGKGTAKSSIAKSKRTRKTFPTGELQDKGDGKGNRFKSSSSVDDKGHGEAVAKADPVDSKGKGKEHADWLARTLALAKERADGKRIARAEQALAAKRKRNASSSAGDKGDGKDNPVFFVVWGSSHGKSSSSVDGKGHGKASSSVDDKGHGKASDSYDEE